MRCKVYGMIIILAASMACWFLYNRMLRKHNGDSFEFTLFKFPKPMKCAIPEVAIQNQKNNCIDADFDGWSILHVVLYVVMGALFPGEYTVVLLISILSEMWEYYSGWRARWIVDPAVNLASYWIGSQLSYRFDWEFCKKRGISNKAAVMGAVVLAVFMVINNPDFIGLES